MSFKFTPIIGVIEDIHDPQELGRVRVRVFGEHTKSRSKLPINALKWFSTVVSNSVGMSGVGDSPTGYAEGSMVFGYFVDDEHQEGIIIGSITGYPTKSANVNAGFNDPTGTYPVYINESDVNRLARGIETTLVTQKKENAVTGIPGAFSDDTFSEPTTKFAAKYPYNRVMETPSGHVIELDDTSGAERMHFYHKGGTFTEVAPDSSEVHKVKAKSYDIRMGEMMHYVQGDKQISISGDCMLNVMGTYRVKANKIIFDTSTVEIYGESKANDHISSMVSGKDHVHSGVESGGSNTEGPVGKEEGVYTPTPANSFSFSDDDSDWTASKVQEGITKGYFTQEEYEATPTEDTTKSDKTETPTTKKEQTITECGISITSDGSVDYTTQLSTNYKLSDVSTNAAVSQYRIIDQLGLSRQEIACNLKHVALNVLEPIKAQYSNMIVTSGFRQGSGKSQHYKGQAVDMQFPGYKKSQYIEIAKWIQDNIPHDQLLLEYKSYGTGAPWLHVSLTKGTNRYQTLTLWNNKTYSSGIADLSGGA